MLAELQNISKSYCNPEGIATTVLKSVNLSIGANERIAIMGPSGSGKTTLLNILGTLDKPSSGSRFLDNINIENMDEKALASLRNRFIGFVFQQHFLLPQLSLYENVMLPFLAGGRKQKVQEYKDFADYLMEKTGLKDHLHKRPAQLSGGECQRAAVVRALINKPALLLADEPTGSLDISNARLLGSLIIGLSEELKMSLIVVTHSEELASQMEKKYNLISGELI
jgi:ABC-type lipoprotein export system ATPase subunit